MLELLDDNDGVEVESAEYGQLESVQLGEAEAADAGDGTVGAETVHVRLGAEHHGRDAQAMCAQGGQQQARAARVASSEDQPEQHALLARLGVPRDALEVAAEFHRRLANAVERGQEVLRVRVEVAAVVSAARPRRAATRARIASLTSASLVGCGCCCG